MFQQTLCSFICCALLINVSHARSAETDAGDDKIALKRVITEIPSTSIAFLSGAFSKQALPAWALIASTTAITYHYDADLLDGTQRTGRRWGLSNEDHTKTVLRVGSYDVLRLPTDMSSTLYFLGDGWLDAAVAAGFFATGYFGNYTRPYNTSLQLAHGMIVSGLFAQIIKRSTGRESPSDRSEPRGKWRLFPNTNDYNSNTAKYDAMPSGHIMTSTLVFTIIRSNYPEYDSYLFPLEIAWLGALGFAMVNNGVHWASDYPLGIAIGYAVGKLASQMGRPAKTESSEKKVAQWTFFPGMTATGTPVIQALAFF